MIEKPLSYTKRGKLLSAAGGLFGGPLGIIVSPLVLMVINYFTRKRSSQFNRFTVWAILGIVLAPVCWIPVVATGLLATVLYVDHIERTDPAEAGRIQEEWFPSSEKVFQRMRERYPDKSEEWINCIIGEEQSGGSSELCEGR
jgi:MFS family permease